jgi:plastocyanin domain-containing protein
MLRPSLLALPLLSLLAAPAIAAEKAPATVTAARKIEISVTEDGFVPAEIKVKQGEALALAITRKTDKTCATEIVIKEYGINQKLPLGKTVTVNLTTKKAGKVRYACAMDMIAGTLVVE